MLPKKNILYLAFSLSAIPFTFSAAQGTEDQRQLWAEPAPNAASDDGRMILGEGFGVQLQGFQPENVAMKSLFTPGAADATGVSNTNTPPRASAASANFDEIRSRLPLSTNSQGADNEDELEDGNDLSASGHQVLPPANGPLNQNQEIIGNRSPADIRSVPSSAMNPGLEQDQQQQTGLRNTPPILASPPAIEETSIDTRRATTLPAPGSATAPTDQEEESAPATVPATSNVDQDGIIDAPNFCKWKRVRKEIHDLTPAEVRQLKSVLTRAYTMRSKRYPHLSVWEELIAKHMEYLPYLHG